MKKGGTEAVKIEKGIPIPTNPRKGFSLALSTMKVGDSFAAPVTSRNMFSGMAKKFNIKVKTKKTSDTECRVWRIA